MDKINYEYSDDVISQLYLKDTAFQNLMQRRIFRSEEHTSELQSPR